MNSYMVESARTCNNYPLTPIDPRDLAAVFAHAVEVGEVLDRVKKLMVYGKDLPVCWDNGIALDLYDDFFSVDYGHIDKDIIHAVLGIATEAGELVDAVLTSMEKGSKIDPVNLSEETGDLLWYQALLLRHLGKTFEDVMEQNVAKLKARYPDKFTAQLALVRNLDHERSVLESTQ